MKIEKIILLFIIFVAFSLTSCSDDLFIDNTPPDPPTNVTAFLGDGVVEISWEHNRENDLAGYNVYFSFTYEGQYELIGSTVDNFFVDVDAVNGEKYYYGVAAYDHNGNESELSYDVVVGIPRPEGFNQSIFDYLKFPSTAGYSLMQEVVVPFDDIEADFFFENFEGTYYLNVWEEFEIQDLGVSQDIYDYSYAPNSNWIPLIPNDNVKYVEAMVGHTYAILTIDNHYAKIRIKAITSERMIFDWAYQLLEGENLFKRVYNKRSEKNREVIIKSR